MGWAVGYDERWSRDVGYGVPSLCDYPACESKIDRGLSYVCGGEPYGGERGCGLYFCAEHLLWSERLPQVCARCLRRARPFRPSPDVAEWMRHKLRDPSWAQWRAENPAEVAGLRSALLTLTKEPA